MRFPVIVRLVDRTDPEQPEPFFLGSGAVWSSVELMLKSLYGDPSVVDLDVRYWDDEDLVILSSQDELSEACRLATEKGILHLFVRNNDSKDSAWPDPSSREFVINGAQWDETQKKCAVKSTTAESISGSQPEDGTAVDPSGTAAAVVTFKFADSAVKYVPTQDSSAAGVETSMVANDTVSSAQAVETVDIPVDAGAADQEHKMVPGAQSGANVIAIEMPECPFDALQDDGSEQQGTEAAEPAEMAETGEVAPKSGRDAETGFWLVSKNQRKGECTGKSSSSSHKEHLRKPGPKETSASDVVAQKKTEGKVLSSSDKSHRRKHQTDALTQETFYDFMAKYKSELKRDIVKDMARKTVRQVVEAVCKMQADQQKPLETGKGDAVSKWPISFHEKIICDHCDENIVGPRYKCGNCLNYDLCETCEDICPPVHDINHVFLKLRRPCFRAGIRHGIRIPLLKRYVYQSKGQEENGEEKRGKVTAEELNRMAEKLKVKEAKVKEKLERSYEKLRRRLDELQIEDPLNGSPCGVLSAEFVSDETIPDGRIVSPGELLKKSWLMRNNGTMNWPSSTVLQMIRSTMQAEEASVLVGLVLPGETTIITVKLIAPETNGDCESHWRLHSNGQVFGHTVFCKVRVEVSAPAEPKLFTPLLVESTSDDPQEGWLLCGEHKNGKQAQQSEEQRENSDIIGMERGTLIQFQQVDKLASQDSKDEEVQDPWAANKLKKPSILVSSSQPSPAVPSTPNNTPFAVSPPSGRCVSPPLKVTQQCMATSCSSTHLGEMLCLETYKAFMGSAKKTSLQETEAETEDDETVQHNLRSWMERDLLMADDSEPEAASQTRKDKSSAVEFDTLESFPLLQLVPSAPIRELDAVDEVEADAESNDDDSGVYAPVVLKHVDLQRAKENNEEDLEEYGGGDSCSEQLLSDSRLKREATEEVASDDESMYEVMRPTAFSSTFRNNASDAENEASDLMTEAHAEEGPLQRHFSHEMSPGSTASSVEVVSVEDLEEFEEKDKLEDEYRSIDTHGAWFSPGHQPLIRFDCEKDVEGYEILPGEFSSLTDEASSDEDFCIVVPDCFDTSKPLDRSRNLGQMEKLSHICLKEMERQTAGVHPSCPSYMEGFEHVKEETCNDEKLPDSELEAYAADDSEKLTVSSTSLQSTLDEQHDMRAELQASNEKLDHLLRCLKSKAQSLEAEDPREADERKPGSEFSAERKEVVDEDKLHSGPAELAVESQTEATVEADQDEANKTAAATASAPTVNDIIDPGPHLNALVQSTVKAATSGLQHLYKTTKDVIKTLQADTYDYKESSYEFRPSNYVLPKSTWQPSNKQYMPPRNDFQPPKSDFRLPESTYTGPKTQPVHCPAISDEFVIPLQRIREMGYFNNERNLQLLKKHNGDVHRVVNELCQESDNDWARKRH